MIDKRVRRLQDALQSQNHREIHNLLLEMDQVYRTLPTSPLHHDKRCPLHKRGHS